MCALWCSQLGTEIINQKQLQCTWQKAALPSLQETCFIYTSSLVACRLTAFQVQYLKVSCWRGLHLGSPQGSPTLGSGQEIPPCLCKHSRLPHNPHIWADADAPGLGHICSRPCWVPPVIQGRAMSWTPHVFCLFSGLRTALSQHPCRISSSQKACKAGRWKWRSL